MNTKRVRAVAVALLVVSAASACGEDETLSASEYRKDGNAICEDVGPEVRAAVPDEQPTVHAIQQEAAPALARALSRLGDRLDDLRPPPSLARGHDQLLSAVHTAVATSEQAARDQSVAARLRDEGPPLDELGNRAGELGLTSCTR